MHRQKADEAYQIGERGHPVRAYLDVDEIIRAAVASGADAIYPGYGFLSENPQLAAGLRRRRDHLHRPVGRGPGDGRQQGDGRRRGPGRRRAGAGVVASRRRTSDADHRVGGRDRVTRCSSRPSPAAAVAGCAGSTRPDELPEALATAMREAESAFGDPTVFLERAVVEPRHIEVQILADHRAADGIRPARSTCTSATARCSAGTRR